MDFTKFSSELSTKRRSISDLARFVSTRTDLNPNYTLLIGAGCSVTSGIRSASTLANLWRKELYETFAGKGAIPTASIDEQQEFLKAHQGSWYDQAREYSSLFEKRYDLQRQRRMFVETEVAGKVPSIGYAYLTALVEQNYFNTIFTTNFDDLVNEAFYVYSEQRPIVCAHDSSINSVTVTSKRPKVIKLHGDYLFDDLKSTARETESLEQNMKAKFAEFSKDYGLIVVGYSGGDRSIMDVLSTLLKNDEYLKNGIYWCIRNHSDVPEELRKLMWRERVYFVEIDGFDELFAELYSRFNNGDVLPRSALSGTCRPADTAARLLANEKLFPSTSEVLRKARERLERQSKRTTLVNLIVRPEQDSSDKAFSDSGLSDDELIILTEVQGLISSDQHGQAIDKARESLRGNVRIGMKVRLLKLVVQAYQAAGKISEALAVTGELIALQPRNAAHHLLKAAVLPNINDRLQSIEEAISRDRYSVEALLDKARVLREQANTEYGDKRRNLIAQAQEALDQGIKLDPSWRNPCWRERFDLLQRNDSGIEKSRADQLEIINTLNKQNPFSARVLRMRQIILRETDNKETFDDLLTTIKEAKDRAGPDLSAIFDSLELKVIGKSNDTQALESAVQSALTKESTQKDETLALVVAKLLREKLGRDQDAIKLLTEALRYVFDEDVLVALIRAHIDHGDNQSANTLYTKWSTRLSLARKSRLKIELLDAEHRYTDSLTEIQRFQDEVGLSNMPHRIYLNLKLKNYEEAEKLARSVLAPINYSAEAVAITVNLELARKMRGNKPDTHRLEAAMKFDQNPPTNAAVYALLDKKADMLDNIRKAMKNDMTFRFDAMDWPVFESYRNDAAFKEAIKI